MSGLNWSAPIETVPTADRPNPHPCRVIGIGPQTAAVRSWQRDIYLLDGTPQTFEAPALRNVCPKADVLERVAEAVKARPSQAHAEVMDMDCSEWVFASVHLLAIHEQHEAFGYAERVNDLPHLYERLIDRARVARVMQFKVPSHAG